MLDRVEVGGVSRQRQEFMPVLFENFGYFGLVVERRIIHDHKACRPKRGQQHFFDPCCYGQVSTACVEQHGSNPVFTTLSHDEVGSLTFVAGDSAEDLSAPGRPAMGAVYIGLEATLIKINNILPAMFGNPTPQFPKKCDSFFVTTFSIPGRFF